MYIGRPNTVMEPTPLGGRKIGAFSKVGNGPSVFPIYRCGAANAQAVGPLPSHIAPFRLSIVSSSHEAYSWDTIITEELHNSSKSM